MLGIASIRTPEIKTPPLPPQPQPVVHQTSIAPTHPLNTGLTASETALLSPRRTSYKIKTKRHCLMGIKPKTTREHILSLYGHISGVKKNLSHVHGDVEKLGGKIDKIYWVLLTVAGTAVIFMLERMFG